ncbi:Oidioi.mRNA.OKI2018_I69.PAR.g12847.t1.cds [Oikopleura dioica]|uniref:Oidioi.mRNA.OKI2018_I69.PAR.g12847.t1.cds n=1 Tax=Oikopleura dioica TaxID=34765 RepID=A0ABN7S1X0_OIKDI|nr:Oidioi.mRNA.OKI2018_I69.PAR.g12847.t1.cds [Oikopleura dioica]
MKFFSSLGRIVRSSQRTLESRLRENLIIEKNLREQAARKGGQNKPKKIEQLVEETINAEKANDVFKAEKKHQRIYKVEP